MIRDMHGIKAIKCDIPALIEELDAKAAGKDYGEQSDDSLFLKSYLTFLKVNIPFLFTLKKCSAVFLICFSTYWRCLP